MTGSPTAEDVRFDCGRPQGQCIKGDRAICDAPVSGEWVDCPVCCGEGLIEGECTCMDDTCCCLVPTPPVCEECNGAGGWIQR